MNRRNFLKTGAAAVTATTAVAGCLGGGAGSNPDIPIQVATSPAFKDLASYEEPEITVKETDDGEEYLQVAYEVTPEKDKCVDLSADVKLFDNDDVVLDEAEYREQYDPGQTYRMKHNITNDAEELGKITIALSVNTLSGMCYDP